MMKSKCLEVKILVFIWSSTSYSHNTLLCPMMNFYSLSLCPLLELLSLLSLLLPLSMISDLLTYMLHLHSILPNILLRLPWLLVFLYSFALSLTSFSLSYFNLPHHLHLLLNRVNLATFVLKLTLKNWKGNIWVILFSPEGCLTLTITIFPEVYKMDSRWCLISNPTLSIPSW